MSGRCNKALGKALGLKERYLFSGRYDNGELVPGSVKPLADMWLAVAVPKPGPVAGQTIKETELWCSNATGQLDQLQADFDRGCRGRVFKLGDEVPFIIPPLSTLVALYADAGPEAWRQRFGKALPAAQIEALTDSKTPLRLLEVEQRHLQPPGSGSTESSGYRDWYAGIGANQRLEGLVLPRSRVAVIAFSSALFDGCRVDIWPEGQAKGVIEHETVAAPKIQSESSDVPQRSATTSTQKPYAVAFIKDVDDGELQPGLYHIRVTFPFDARIGSQFHFAKNEEGDYYYELKERLRFDIHNLAGEFSLLNGDPLLLEETLVKQMPQLYGNVIRSARKLSQGGNVQLTPGLAAYGHDLSLRQWSTGMAAKMLGADSPSSRFFAYAPFISATVTKSGFKEAQTLAAATFDSIALYQSLGDVKKWSNPVSAELAGKWQDLTPGKWFKSGPGGWLEDLGAPEGSLANRLFPPGLMNFLGKAQTLYDLLGKPVAVAESVMAYSKFQDSRSDNLTRHGELVQSYAEQMSDRSSVADMDQVASAFEALASSSEADTSGVLQVEGHRLLRLTLYFDTGAAEPDVDSQQLQAVVDLLKKQSRARVLIKGHADRVGSDDFNQALSQYRAEQLAQRLLQQEGASPEQLSVRGLGVSQAQGTAATLNRRDRRVELEVSCPSLATRIWPSREGMQNLERSRARTEADGLQLDKLNKQVLGSLYDASLGLAALFPATAPFALTLGAVEASGALLKNLTLVVDDILLDKCLNNYLQQQALQSDLNQRSRVNRQSIGKRATSGESEVVQTLDHQFRIRADVLNGLAALINRASIDARMNFFNEADVAARFQALVKAYRLEEYIRLFVLSDSWQYPLSPTVNLSMDQYWLDFLGNPDRLNSFKEAPNELSAEAFLHASVKNEQNRVDANADLLMGSSLRGALQMPSLAVEASEVSLPVSFQQLFPIHGVRSDSFEALFEDLDISYSELDRAGEDIFAYTAIYVRPFDSSLEDPWQPIEQHQGPLSPLDQVRVLAVLKPQFSKAYPLTLRPMRELLGDARGPAYTEISHKLEPDELINDEAQYQGCFGAVFYPRYYIGQSNFLGTKPLSTDLAYLIDRHRWRRDGQMTMDYYYQIGVEAVANDKTCRPIRVDVRSATTPDEPSEAVQSLFQVRLDGNADPQQRHMFNEAFLKSEAIDFKYPELFKGRPSVRLLFKIGQRPWVCASPGFGKILAANYSDIQGEIEPGRRRELALNEFDWQQPVQLASLVCCDTIEQQAYQAYEQRWRRIPYACQLWETCSGGTEGETIRGQLVYLGEVDVRFPKIEDKGGVFSSVGQIKAQHEMAKTGATITLDASAALQEEVDYFGLDELQAFIEQPENAYALCDQLVRSGYSVGRGFKRHLFAAVHQFSYRSLTGETVKGMRPFGKDHTDWLETVGRWMKGHSAGEIDINEDAPQRFEFEIKNFNIPGQPEINAARIDGLSRLQLSAPSSYFEGVPWTALPADDKVQQARQQLAVNANKQPGQAKPYTPTPLMSWLTDDDQQRRRGLVKQWIENGEFK